MQAEQVRPAEGIAYKWRSGIVVILGLFMAALDTTIVSVALPQMAHDFTSSFSTISWVATGYFLAQAAVIPVTGYLSDRVGTKTVFLVATAIFVAASVLCAVAPSKEFLIAGRVLQGIGGGGLFPISLAIAYRAFPRYEWGRASAVLGVPILLAPVLGPVLGGYLTTTFDWRIIFIINLPVGALALFLAWRILKSRAEDAGDEAPPDRAFDVPGFALSMAGFTMLTYGLTEAGIRGWGDAAVHIFLLVAVVLLLAFVIVELRVEAPVLDVRLFLNFTYTRVSLVAWLVVGILFGSLFLIPFFFEKVEGTSALTAGEILITQGVTAAIGMLLSGELYNRVGPRWLITAGATAVALSTIGFTHLGVGTTGLSLQGWLVLRGLGLGFSIQPMQNLALSTVAFRDLARATSLYNVTRQVATAAGIAVLTAFLTQRATGHGATLVSAARSHATSGAAGACLATSPNRVALAGCLQRHALVMGLNDTFVLALAVSSLAVIVALFVGRDVGLEALKATARGELRQALPRLSPSQLLEAAARGVRASYPAGEIIVHQGDQPDHFYVVMNGEVKVTRQTEGGDARELATLGPGEFFGEMGLVANVPRTATVTASRPTEVLSLDKSAFADILGHSPATEQELKVLVSQRLAILP